MGRDIRPRIFNVNTQSDVIKFILERVDEIIDDRANYHFVDIGAGGGFVTSKVSGFASTKGYEITKGEDFFDIPAIADPTIYYMFNPFAARDTARLNAHLRDASGYLVYYDAQWTKLLNKNSFKKVYEKLIVGGKFEIYEII